MSEFDLSIANLSYLSDSNSFLLQISMRDPILIDFIKNMIPKKEKKWIEELKSWEIENKWLLDVADLCIDAYEQVFFDRGDDFLMDLKQREEFKKFKSKIRNFDF